MWATVVVWPTRYEYINGRGSIPTFAGGGFESGQGEPDYDRPVVCVCGCYREDHREPDMYDMGVVAQVESDEFNYCGDCGYCYAPEYP